MQGREKYTLGYSPASVAMMSTRTADNHAAFFIEKLKSGMEVLDVGCGPGTITLGFAEKVFPGKVIGLELNLEQTKAVRIQAESLDVDLEFQTGNIYNFNFPDSTFDAVFASALIGNLQHPIEGLKELKRVLRPSGVLGIKEFDHSANIIFPEPHFQKEVYELYNRLRIENGHDPDSGRKLKGYLYQAGFENVDCRAIFENLSVPIGKGSPIMEALVKDEWGPEFVRLGWATEQQINEWIKQSRDYEHSNNTFVANAWVEARCQGEPESGAS